MFRNAHFLMTIICAWCNLDFPTKTSPPKNFKLNKPPIFAPNIVMWLKWGWHAFHMMYTLSIPPWACNGKNLQAPFSILFWVFCSLGSRLVIRVCCFNKVFLSLSLSLWSQSDHQWGWYLAKSITPFWECFPNLGSTHLKASTRWTLEASINYT